jgi:hypothetical protein
VARVAPDQASSLELEVGVTGEPSLAAPVHKWFHRSLGKHEPVGWEYQVPFEPAFLLRYESRRAYPLLGDGLGKSFAVEPLTSVALGTLRTGVTGGLSLLASVNAPATLDWLGATDTYVPYLLLKVGLEAEFVLRDLFLDGRILGSSPSVHRLPWVGRLQGRAQVGFRRLALEFAATRSTLEFQSQDDPHTHGTIALIFRW